MSEFKSPSLSDFEQSDPSGFRHPDLNTLVPVETGEQPREVPDFVKRMSGGEKAAVAAGNALLKAKRAFQQAGWGLESAFPITGKKKLADQELVRLDAERADAEDKLRFLKQDPAFKAGDFGAEALMGTLVPFKKGTTVLGTAMKNILPNAAYSAAKTEGDISDRLKAGAEGGIGAAGGIAAMGLGGKALQVLGPRVLNKFTKNPLQTSWSNPVDRANQNLADEFGAPLSLGDLKPGGLVEKIENWFPGKASRDDVLKAQAAALIQKLHPENTVVSGMKKTQRALKKRGDDIFEPLNKKVAGASLLVPTDNMHTAARELYDRFPKLFTDTNLDTQARDRLLSFVSEDTPPALTFDEFRTVQKAVGQAQSRAQDLVGRGEFPSEALGLAKKTYSMANDDINAWGSSATGTSKKTAAKYKDIVDTYHSTMDQWRKEVLPFENNSFTKTVLGRDQTPETTIKNILDPMERTNREAIVSPELSKYSPETKRLFDAVKLMNRASKEAITEDPIHGIHWLDAMAALTHPGLVGAQQGLAKGTSNPLFKDTYLSAFDDLLPAETAGRWNTGVSGKGLGYDLGGALSQLGSTVPITYGRENGDEVMGYSSLPALLMNEFFPEEEKSIGSESSTRGQGGIK